MQFDDRLATVLRSRIASEQAARTQYLQLLDLLGTAPYGAQSDMMDRAYLRLDELDEMIAPRDRAALVRISGARMRDPRLVYRLSQSQEPAIVSAAMSSARLSDSDWLDLIPQLPIGARGYLRHGEHSDAVKNLLTRLGVGDMVLPQGEAAILVEEAEEHNARELDDPFVEAEPEPEPKPETEPESEPELPNDAAFDASLNNQPEPIRAQSEIGEIVRKIEAFRQAKGAADAPKPKHTNDPRLPLGDRDIVHAQIETRAFDFATDPNGRVIWADPAIAPMVYGMVFLDRRAAAPARPDPSTLESLRRQQPVRAGTIELTAAPSVSGIWQIDATPHFSRLTGAYAGYVGRLRRIPAAQATDDPSVSTDEPGDRIRQLLHELRTPVNAIQGFAEVIQQQLFGPAPHEYRALAATIAGDAARMLAGFEEIDRLAKLDAGVVTLAEGDADLLATATQSLAQVTPVLSSREAGFSFTKGKGPFTVAVHEDELERMIWRIFAALSASLEPGEQAKCTLHTGTGMARLRWTLPAALQAHKDLFQATIKESGHALSASAFGSGFGLRLARAEAAASGGKLQREEDKLLLELPLLGENGERHGDNSQSR